MENVDLSSLEQLSPAEKEYALKILKEFADSGCSEKYNNLKFLLI